MNAPIEPENSAEQQGREGQEGLGGQKGQEGPPERKLHIDEGWKEQIQREREEAEAAAAAAAASPTAGDTAKPNTAKPNTAQPDTAQPSAAKSEGATSGEPQPERAALPPATFSTMVSMLSAQAMAALLGGMAGDEQIPADPPVAKHLIDLLGVLEKKTSGNLDSDESRLLEAVLHELRMAYLRVKKS